MDSSLVNSDSGFPDPFLTAPQISLAHRATLVICDGQNQVLSRGEIWRPYKSCQDGIIIPFQWQGPGPSCLDAQCHSNRAEDYEYHTNRKDRNGKRRELHCGDDVEYFSKKIGKERKGSTLPVRAGGLKVNARQQQALCMGAHGEGSRWSRTSNLGCL